MEMLLHSGMKDSCAAYCETLMVETGSAPDSSHEDVLYQCMQSMCSASEPTQFNPEVDILCMIQP